jgi:hypothetical protein
VRLFALLTPLGCTATVPNWLVDQFFLEAPSSLTLSRDLGFRASIPFRQNIDGGSGELLS